MNRLILLLITVSSLCAAQTNAKPLPVNSTAAQTFSLRKININGSNRIPEADIVAASGLKPGSTVTADDLKQAADRLGESGAFAQVSYRYEGDTAEYTVLDAKDMVPVIFENFIWFADSDLVQRVHKTVPLFSGSVPLTGRLADQVAGALDSILKEKGIQGHTSSMEELAGKQQTMRFQIDGVNAKITGIHFPGADASRVPLLQAAVKAMFGDNYLQSLIAGQVKQNAPPVYGRLGFLKAQFGMPKAVIVKDDPAQPTVIVEVSVEEGDPYVFAGTNWTGVSTLPMSDLAKTVDLKTGAVADTSQISKAVGLAKEMYVVRGYMDAQVKTTATLDQEKHTAVFNLDVKEGPLYHMGKLDVQNLDPERTALIKKIWELNEGDVYDPGYVKSFLKKHPRELASLNGWFSRYSQTIHDDTHIVDLTLKFEKLEQRAK